MDSSVSPPLNLIPSLSKNSLECLKENKDLSEWLNQLTQNYISFHQFQIDQWNTFKSRINNTNALGSSSVQEKEQATIAPSPSASASAQTQSQSQAQAQAQAQLTEPNPSTSTSTSNSNSASKNPFKSNFNNPFTNVANNNASNVSNNNDKANNNNIGKWGNNNATKPSTRKETPNNNNNNTNNNTNASTSTSSNNKDNINNSPNNSINNNNPTVTDSSSTSSPRNALSPTRGANSVGVGKSMLIGGIAELSKNKKFKQLIDQNELNNANENQGEEDKEGGEGDDSETPVIKHATTGRPRIKTNRKRADKVVDNLQKPKIKKNFQAQANSFNSQITIVNINQNNQDIQDNYDDNNDIQPNNENDNNPNATIHIDQDLAQTPTSTILNSSGQGSVSLESPNSLDVNVVISNGNSSLSSSPSSHSNLTNAGSPLAASLQEQSTEDSSNSNTSKPASLGGAGPLKKKFIPFRAPAAMGSPGNNNSNSNNTNNNNTKAASSPFKFQVVGAIPKSLSPPSSMNSRLLGPQETQVDDVTLIEEKAVRIVSPRTSVEDRFQTEPNNEDSESVIPSNQPLTGVGKKGPVPPALARSPSSSITNMNNAPSNNSVSSPIRALSPHGRPLPNPPPKANFSETDSSLDSNEPILRAVSPERSSSSDANANASNLTKRQPPKPPAKPASLNQPNSNNSTPIVTQASEGLNTVQGKRPPPPPSPNPMSPNSPSTSAVNPPTSPLGPRPPPPPPGPNPVNQNPLAERPLPSLPPRPSVSAPKLHHAAPPPPTGAAVTERMLPVLPPRPALPGPTPSNPSNYGQRNSVDQYSNDYQQESSNSNSEISDSNFAASNEYGGTDYSTVQVNEGESDNFAPDGSNPNQGFSESLNDPSNDPLSSGSPLSPTVGKKVLVGGQMLAGADAILNARLKKTPSLNTNKDTASNQTTDKATKPGAASQPCNECGCVDFKPNPFKKGGCNNCFHIH